MFYEWIWVPVKTGFPLEKSREIRSQVIKWCLLAGWWHLIDVLGLASGQAPRVLVTSYNREFSSASHSSLGPRLQSLIICGECPRLSGAATRLAIKVRTDPRSRDARSEPASIWGHPDASFSLWSLQLMTLSWLSGCLTKDWGQNPLVGVYGQFLLALNDVDKHQLPFPLYLLVSRQLLTSFPHFNCAIK